MYEVAGGSSHPLGAPAPTPPCTYARTHSCTHTEPSHHMCTHTSVHTQDPHTTHAVQTHTCTHCLSPICFLSLMCTHVCTHTHTHRGPHTTRAVKTLTCTHSLPLPYAFSRTRAFRLLTHAVLHTDTLFSHTRDSLLLCLDCPYLS